MKSREDVERTNKISPLAKLVIDWLARHDDKPHASRDIAAALGLLTSEIADEAHRMRIAGFLDKKFGADELTLHQLLLKPEIRALYAPAPTPNKPTNNPKKAA